MTSSNPGDNEAPQPDGTSAMAKESTTFPKKLLANAAKGTNQDTSGGALAQVTRKDEVPSQYLPTTTSGLAKRQSHHREVDLNYYTQPSYRMII
jgi:hypothetical protein